MAGALARRTEGVKSGSGGEYNGLLAARQAGREAAHKGRRARQGHRDEWPVKRVQMDTSMICR